MAETAIILEEEEAPAETGPLTLQAILEADNVADLLDDAKLLEVGTKAVSEYEIDEASRKDWKARYDRAMKIAMQVREAKNTPWPNASNVKFPLVAVAAIQFQARAYPAIVDGSNLVKGRVIGPDPDGQKQNRADRVGRHMSWQLLFKMPGWEDDTDRLLLMLPIVGCVFRKTYYDKIAGTNCSTMIPADDFVVSYWAKSLESTPRYTHILRYYPYEVRERIRNGIWREVPIDNDDKTNDEDSYGEYLEQFRLIDLDEDGYPEPYVVTLTKEGAVARIVPCFDESGVIIGPDGAVARIERKQYVVKYGFIPSPDGAFYDIGFGTILEDLNAAIDTTINQMLDAGALQNTQGGFVGSGINIKSGATRFKQGEWKRVDVTGGTLRDNIFPLALNGPSSVLFSLLQMLIQAAKDITATQDIMTGGAPTANTPATTTLAQIEQGMKVMSAIFKRIHRSFRDELKILFDLNRMFLDEEEYFNLNDQTGAVGRDDYQERDLDVIPVSDPTMVSDIQKMARAQYLMQFFGNPMVNQQVVLRRALEAGGIPDVGELLNVEPPPPDPKLLLDGMKQQNEREKTQSDMKVNEADIRAKDAQTASSLAQTALNIAQFAATTGEVEMMKFAQDLATIGGDLARQVAEETAEEGMEGAEDEFADEQGGVQPLVGPPGDGGIPGLPEGLPGDDGGEMGLGGADEPGGPGGGGIDGATDGVVL
jgi:chaperonin GroES